MNKLIITPWKNGILSMIQENGAPTVLDAEPRGQHTILGNIYIGKVKHIVKNINAAFVDIGDHLTGYLSLGDGCIHFASQNLPQRPVCEGDEIVVQVEKEAVKTKALVLTSNLNFTGRYCVLTAGKNQIGFSSKIHGTLWKNQIRPFLEEQKDEDFGIIVRTNAESADIQTVLYELRQLKQIYRAVMNAASHRTCFSLLYRSYPPYITAVRDSVRNSLDAIITDDREIFENMKEYLSLYQPEDIEKLTFYEDSLLPLSKLYRLEKALDDALDKRVWLKSGGYLVIEPTEALVVIDVNTGKYSGKKNLRVTILKINCEAAVEISRQLRLRNLSGIILVDFIDMEAQADKKALMSLLTEKVSKDPVKTVVVDMTKLNLVELTRKKIRRPLTEQIKQLKSMPEALI